MIIDDDVYIGNMLEEVLTKEGYGVFRAYSGTEALLSKLQVDKMFQRFYTVETGTNSNGLGLSIAKVLTEKMNGSITASYMDGKISIQLRFTDSVEKSV